MTPQPTNTHRADYVRAAGREQDNDTRQAQAVPVLTILIFSSPVLCLLLPAIVAWLKGM